MPRFRARRSENETVVSRKKQPFRKEYSLRAEQGIRKDPTGNGRIDNKERLIAKQRSSRAIPRRVLQEAGSS